MKFYTFSQNNSGGYYEENDDDGIGPYVIIQAPDVDTAITKMKDLTDYKYDSYCVCCGERWSTWMDESDGKEVPSIYDTNVFEYVSGYSWLGDFAFIHYNNGEKEKVFFKTT